MPTPTCMSFAHFLKFFPEALLNLSKPKHSNLYFRIYLKTQHFTNYNV
jgi:hypothetical protein